MRKLKAPSTDARTSKQANLRLFQASLNSALKNIGQWTPEELFTVEFRGYKFNALPFLCNGACYFDTVCYDWLLKYVARELPIRKDITLQELQRNRLLGVKVFDALLPGCHGRRELWALMFDKNMKDTITLFFQCASRAMNRVILFDEFLHINYKYKEICNTQAFCLYLCVWWLCNLTPALRKQIEPNFRKHDFENLLYRLCPEDSLHFKYIKGELSEDELVRRYDGVRLPDDSTIAVREAYSNCSKGNYTGEPMSKEQWSVGREEYDFLSQGGEIGLNRMVAYAYLYSGAYDKMLSDIDRAKAVQEHARSAEARAKQKYAKAADQCKALKQEKIVMQEKITHLQREISSHVTSEDLHKRVAELEAELREARAETDTLFDERLALKQELSRSTKEIKQLRARLENQEEEADQGGSEPAEVTIEEMVAALKDKRIVMIGGDRSKSLTKTFEDWGFKSFVNMSGNVRRADCDFLVICSVLCAHGDVYQAERMIKGQDAIQVFVNGVNAEMILRALWDAMG